MIDIVISELTLWISNIATKAATSMVAVIGIGLSIYAVKYIVGVVKTFFVCLSEDYHDYYEYTHSYNADPEGWTEEDEREYRAAMY